jgi:thiol-disulfide isomerase/thioredoxin
MRDFQKRLIAHMKRLMLAADEFQKNYPKSEHYEEAMRILAGTSFSLSGAPDSARVDPETKKAAAQITNELVARKDLPASVDRVIVEAKVTQLQIASRRNMNQKDKIGEVIKKQQAMLQEHRKRYPKDAQVAVLYMQVADFADEANLPTLARELLNEVGGFSEGEIKAAVEARMKTLGMIGKPVEIKFTAIDGGKIDLGSLKGKVVLIDFWATWCVPCVQAFPNVKKIYDKYHDQGFEIIGISLDEKENELKKFVKEKNVPWPQYFDGKMWENEISSRFGVDSIPAMWLVDKDGNVATLKAREDLEQNVKTLLAGGKL